MSGVDVRDLANEELPVGKFPVDPRADFRLYIAPEVRRGIEEHAKADVSVEICGVLVGNWGTDGNGPFAAVTNYIPCQNAASKFAEVTFTHESWALINKEMDSKYADARIIGWYHSHPDFGIFLSDRDAFIQEHFFSGPGQVAYVIDPVRELEGVFAWRNGKPTPLAHYWIGNTVRTVEASERGPNWPMPSHGAVTSATVASPEKSWDSSPLGMATLVLGVLALFLGVTMYGGWRARGDEELKRYEAVARIADIDLIRMTRDAELASVRQRLAAIDDSLDKIPSADEKLTKEQLEEAGVRRKAIERQLKLGEEDLRRVQALSNTEYEIYSRIVQLKASELPRMIEAINLARNEAEAERKAAAEKDTAKESPAGAKKNQSSETSAQAPPPSK